MKSTKNEPIRSEVRRGLWRVKPRTFLKISREDLPRIPILLAAGFISAFFILERLNVEQLLGGFLISSLLLFILYKDIMRYKPALVKDFNMLLLYCLILVFTLFIGRVFNYLLHDFSMGAGFIPTESVIFGMPLPAGAMLVTLLFDFHAAITFSFAASILMSLWLNDASYTIYAFVGSLTAAFSVIRCKKRSALLWGGVTVMLVNIVTVIILCLFEGTLFTPKALFSVAFATIAGISVAALVSLLLPILEHIFHVTTDISLLELLDLNQPIVRNLMVAAPGTYHHSVILRILWSLQPKQSE
jgi:membrane-associated HD superfamily phosphohydrolase